MKSNIVFLLNEIDKKMCFNDLVEARDVVSCPSAYKKMHTKIGSFIEKTLLANKFRKYVPERIRQQFYNWDSINIKNDKNIIVVQSLVAARTSEQYMRHFKDETNSKLYLLLIDSLDAHSDHLKWVRPLLNTGLFDHVLTYDKYEAQKYGFNWIGYSYYSDKHSKDYRKENQNQISNDLYYVGSDKDGRNETIYEVYKYLIKHDIKCEVDIPRPKHPHKSFNYMKKKIPYSEVIERVKSSNCILEILMDGQEAQSLRYFEAVTLNKKLLTNNKHIAELPFYNEQYMKHFNEASDIDLDWVKEKQNVDYGYRGGTSLQWE